MLKTRRIPRTLSALLLAEASIHGFYWIFATLAHAHNKSWRSRTNPDTRVLGVALPKVGTRVEERRNKSYSKTGLIILAYQKKKRLMCNLRERGDLKRRKRPATNDSQDSSMTKRPCSGIQP